MAIKIHTSKKLEKVLHKIILVDSKEESTGLEKWNATLFYVSRKKCLLIANAKTQYNVILTNFKTGHLKTIQEKFRNAFYLQLKYDKIEVDADFINAIAGEVTFYKTDNNRKNTGFLSYRIQELEYYKCNYEDFESVPFNELTSILNNCPTQIGSGRKMTDYSYPVDEMRNLLSKM